MVVKIDTFSPIDVIAIPPFIDENGMRNSWVSGAGITLTFHQPKDYPFAFVYLRFKETQSYETAVQLLPEWACKLQANVLDSIETIVSSLFCFAGQSKGELNERFPPHSCSSVRISIEMQRKYNFVSNN